jgi:hypothetical protein
MARRRSRGASGPREVPGLQQSQPPYGSLPDLTDWPQRRAGGNPGVTARSIPAAGHSLQDPRRLFQDSSSINRQMGPPTPQPRQPAAPVQRQRPPPIPGGAHNLGAFPHPHEVGTADKRRR